MIDKKELRKEFRKDWKKHYEIGFFLEEGFKRQQCKKCGDYFWALEEREVCADAQCIGFQFIGKKPTKKSYDYVETWKQIEKYFNKTGHETLQHFPTVPRWREDIFFTMASINNFQPYVVRGELEPPANPLIVLQPCVRFVDITNIGVTGSHFSTFDMIGQHAFNTKKTGLFYWKNEALRHDYEYVTKVIGIPKEEMVFREDVWAGGGNFGPSMEYFVQGLELGNCVFMQYEELPGGNSRELKTKVIDMGAGHERLAWITNNTPNAYEVVFGPVIDRMKKVTGVRVDRKLLLDYFKYGAYLNVDEAENLAKKRKEIAEKLGYDEEKLFRELAPLQALYAIADHLKTILFTSADGMLPSNSGGGYNLRMLMRRVFGFKEEYGFDLEYAKIFEDHAKHLKDLYPSKKESYYGELSYLTEGIETATAIVEEEEKKYKKTLDNGRKKVVALAQKYRKEKKKITPEDFVRLYESDGIPIEVVEEEALKQGVGIDKPDDFYGLIAKKDKGISVEDRMFDVAAYKPTKQLYREDEKLTDFTAVVQGVEDKYVILDKTAFYPTSGGQASDLGMLNGVPVIDVLSDAGVILHAVKFPEKFRRGQKVSGSIDINRRARITKHHTAAHLLNASARKVLGRHVWQAGAYKDHEKGHLDITHYKRITQEQLDSIEALANQMIIENHKVSKKFMPRNQAEELYGFRLYQGGFVPGKIIRVLEVEGVDVEACGGTHVDWTGEIGLFKIVKREGIQDGVERIVYKAGIPAVIYMQERESQLRESSQALKVPETNLVMSVERFFNEWKEQKKLIEKLQGKAAESAIIELSEKLSKGKQEFYKEVVEGLEENVLTKTAKEIISRNPGKALMIATPLKDKVSYVIVKGKKSKVNAVKALEALNKECSGQGGGSEEIARGFCPLNYLGKVSSWKPSTS